MAKLTGWHYLKMYMYNARQKIRMRNAEASDRAFVIESILSAEKGGLGIAVWCAIFELSENEFSALLEEIINEEIENQEWYLPAFYILEIEGKNAAALSAWIENAQYPSALLKGNFIHYFISQEKQIKASEPLKIISEITLSRSPGALQLECVYTHPEFRGQRMISKLISFVEEEFKTKTPELKQVEIQVSNTNTSALKSYLRSRFRIDQESQSQSPHISQYFSGTGKIRLSKSLV